MQVGYVTSKKYPASSADHVYIRELARSFVQQLGNDFHLIVRRTAADVESVQAMQISPFLRLRSLSLFCFLTAHYWKRDTLSSTTHFISNEAPLLVVLWLLRWLFWKDYQIIFDAHMLSGSWRDRLTLRLVDKVITTSDVLRGHVLAACSSTHPPVVQTIWGGVDPTPYQDTTEADWLAVRSSLGIATDAVVLGYVGGFRSLGHEKGLTTMIDALPHLPPHYHVLLVGGTPEEVGALQEYAAHTGVGDRCHIHSAVPFKAVPSHQLACDLLVIPYPDEPHFRDYGFPMKVFEYIAAQRPILYSRLPIMDDLLEQVGYAFAPSDPQALAAAAMEAHTTRSFSPVDTQAYTWEAKVAQIIAFLAAETD